MADTYTVVRSRTIPAPVEQVYPLIADFHQWTRWSPWEDVDPDLHRDYSGPDSGQGAVYAWSGNRKAGSGRMESRSWAPACPARSRRAAASARLTASSGGEGAAAGSRSGPPTAR